RRRMEVEAQKSGGPRHTGQAEGAEELPFLTEDVHVALSVVRAAEIEVRHVDVARPAIDGDALGIPFPGGQAGEGRRLAPIPGWGGRGERHGEERREQGIAQHGGLRVGRSSIFAYSARD